jgi:hypothetical protein
MFLTLLQQQAAAGSVTVTPGTGSLTLTGFVASLAASSSVALGAGSLALTGLAASAAAGSSTSPGTQALILTGFAPDVSVGTNATASPGVGSLVITGYAPTVSTSAAPEEVQSRSQGGFDPHYYKKRKKKQPEPVSKDFGDDWQPPTPRPAIPPIPAPQDVFARQDAAIARTQAQLASALQQLARQQAEAEQEDEDEAIMLLMAA